MIAYAEWAGWYWQPALPLGPDPFAPPVHARPAFTALAEAGYAETDKTLAAWSNRFGHLITAGEPGKYGWCPDLAEGGPSVTGS